MSYRVEKDSLGEIEVPADKYWGAQTQRSLQNFKIGPAFSMPIEIVHAFGYLKKACAMSNARLGYLTDEKLKLIIQVCDEITEGKLDEHFPLVIWQTGSGTHTNMNCNEVISNRAQVLQSDKSGQGTRFVHPNDDVNMSQSSNDTFPTAMHIAAYSKLAAHTIPALEALMKTLLKKSDEMAHVVKIGRTHLMDATPITLGQEFSGYAAQLEYGIRALRNTMEHLSELAIGGTAVGTGLNAPAGFDADVAETIAQLTNLPFKTAPNKFEALAANDALVESHGALKQLAVSLMKIANDIRMSASGPRSGIGELIIPPNEPGSSIMPGKINPTQAEAVTMVCARIMGNDTTISVAGSNGHFQLNVFKPVMISTFLESATLLGDAARSFNENCTAGIEPDKEKIDQNLRNSLMLVTALNPHIGYDKSAIIAKKAYAENISLREAAIGSGFVNEQQYDEWVIPEAMTGNMAG